MESPKLEPSPYHAPALHVLGRLSDLTGLNFPTTSGDFNFEGTEIGATS